MADAAAPAAPSPIWDTLKAYAPSLGQCLVLVTGLIVGATGTWIAKPSPPHMVIAAADPPRPTPIACAQELHDLDLKGSAIRTDLALLRELIEARIPAPTPRVAPSKVRAKGIAP